MFQLVEKRRWYFILSALIIIPGLVAMIYSTVTTGLPFKVSIDFTGGTLWVLEFPQAVPPADLRAIFVESGISDAQVTTVGNSQTLQVRTKTVTAEQKAELETAINAQLGPNVTELEFNEIGPALGSEVSQAATLAVIAAAGAILVFLTLAFRKVAHPVRYGVSAVAGMIHDILVTLGIFSILSLLLGWEADALFLTALLTVIGFSVQDKIVVFDRIRENSPKYRGEAFTRIANRSLLETLHRSLATQLCTMFMMVALLLFGGATIRQFIAVMFLGLVSGTYSSIFNSVPILVGWEERDLLGTKTQQPASA
jgi:preprotein translocase SecF subunit